MTKIIEGAAMRRLEIRVEDGRKNIYFGGVFTKSTFHLQVLQSIKLSDTTIEGVVKDSILMSLDSQFKLTPTEEIEAIAFLNEEIAKAKTNDPLEGLRTPTASLHFNKLTPEQTEALAILAEECAEVVQVVGKILRHGLENFDPTAPENQIKPRGYETAFVTNRELLEREIGHVKCAIEMLEGICVVDQIHIDDSHDAKRHSVREWLHHINPDDE